MTPIPKGTNVLFGRVLDLGTAAPVGGAVVSLTGYFESSGRPAASFRQKGMSPLASAPRSVMTTANGYHLFGDLTAGRYSIAASALGNAGNIYPRISSS